jgi:glycogen debranching enzyme
MGRGIGPSSAPAYTYPVDTLFTGSSLGNALAFARLDRETNLCGLWSSADNEFYVGRWHLDILHDGLPLGAVETAVTPESQCTRFAGGGLRAEKQFFLPFLPEMHNPQRAPELRSGMYIVRITNTGRSSARCTVHHSMIFPATRTELFTKQPRDDELLKPVEVALRQPVCEVLTAGRASEARVFGSPVPWTSCRADETTVDAEYVVKLGAGEERTVPFVLSFSPRGIEEAREAFRAAENASLQLERSVETFRQVLSRSRIVTPDPVINRGLQWAKVNTVRVQHCYRAGQGFTNDPPQDIIVMRDLAWYVLGADYLSPEFSAAMLELAERHAVHEGGKLTEYIHANEEKPELHDYGLNINDDTPLMIYALYHHAICCDDAYSLEHVYPMMRRAGEWILRQMRDGLVWCDADGTGVRGICSWRNIIEGYTLSGSVTEINAECCFALGLVGKTAEWLGRRDEAERFSTEAERLRERINVRLRSEKTNLYLLNIDKAGRRHHDVTGDLVFPALFDVADDTTRASIAGRLTADDMWTPFGSRSVSPSESQYDPDFGYQLVGGVWPNLTAWIALSLRSDRPQTLVDGMKNIYRVSEVERPVDYGNVVPGEFPERLHGSTFESRGMTLSPWTPPTYLWLGIEGLLGVSPGLAGLTMTPDLPPEWRWIAVKGLIYRGESIDAILHEGTLYCTHPVVSTYPVIVGTTIGVTSDNPEFVTIGIAAEDQEFVFVASEEGGEGSVEILENLDGQRTRLALGAGEAKVLRFPLRKKEEQNVR